MGRIRLSPTDRVNYPGGDEEGWMPFDFAQLLAQDAGWLEVFEETTGFVFTDFLDGVEKGRARPLRALLWAARKLNGCDDAWASFRPQILLIEQDGVFDGSDADPPAPANRQGRRAAAKASAPRSRARASKT